MENNLNLIGQKTQEVPGSVIKRLFDEAGLSVPEAAKRTGVTSGQLYRTINGKSDISPEMAVRVGRLLSIDPHLLMNVQTDYDLKKAEDKLESVAIESLEMEPLEKPSPV